MNNPDPKSNLEQEIRVLLSPLGIELHSLELPRRQGGVVRVTLDEPGGINLDRLEVASRRIADLLDLIDPIPFRYRLEVGSPGLDRILKVPEELFVNVGHTVKIKTLNPVNGQKVFRGKIESTDSVGVRLVVPAGKKFVTELIPLSEIKEVQAQFWEDAPPREEK
ncbi:MAG: ribosome maturation factor RimP [Leptospirillum sp.]|jgi:ribosome maturation factor RimP